MSALAPEKDSWLRNAINLFTYIYTIPSIEEEHFDVLARNLSHAFPNDFDSADVLTSRIYAVFTELKSKEARRVESITRLVQSTLFKKMNVASKYNEKTPEVVKTQIVNLFRGIQKISVKDITKPSDSESKSADSKSVTEPEEPAGSFRISYHAIFDNPVAMDWLCRAWETKHPSPSSQQ